MSQYPIELELAEEEILRLDISDDELEKAAATGKRNGGAQTIPYALICIPFERG